MRAAFTKTLVELAARDPRILLLTADLGYMALEPFAEKFPERFFNVGVAEQNMLGLATGLAEAGFIPFVYSIATFAVLRPYEFIRNGPIQHRLPVRIVGVGGGVEYGTNGLSHYGLEDVAVMRAQPGIGIIAPADYQQARSALLASWDQPGPIYYRLGKDDKTIVPGLDGRFEPNKLQQIGESADLLFVTMGNVAQNAVAAAQLLRKQNLAAGVAVVAHVHPPPTEELAQALANARIALAVEAHYETGGLGSLLAEIIAERGLKCRLVRCGIPSIPSGVTGSQSYLHHLFGLSPEKLAARALEALGRLNDRTAPGPRAQQS